MDSSNRPQDKRADLSGLLLGWYDRAARDLPWRVPPDRSRAGERPDPYRVWLSEVMLQQTTVAAVTGYFHRFLARWPTVADLAAAPDAEVMAEWAGLGYYARARNLLKGARAVVASENAAFPDSYGALIALPGIGPYTAAAIAAIAFGRPETVVDGNVERVVARLFAVTEPLPKARTTLRCLAASLTPDERPGDFAQAMMDLGATVCTPRKPACMICPLGPHCQARTLGIAADLPVKTPKPAKPERQGLAYVARRADGALLLETRPERGLLGGTLGFPTTGWTVEPPNPAPPFRADWRQLPGTVRHTFTHFHLTLTVLMAEAPPGANPDRGNFRAPAGAPANALPRSLPTLMRKVHDHAFRNESLEPDVPPPDSPAMTGATDT